MTTVPVTPRILRNYKITVGADDYQASTEQVLFQPTAQTQTWTGGDADTHSDSAPATWVLTIGFMQDWGTPDNLGDFLLEHEGEKLEVLFEPELGVGASYTSTVTIVPGALGGTNGAWPTTTAPMPCTKPKRVAPAVPATGATAGSPGTWTPEGSTPPADVDALQASSVTASPTTAWLEGEYVTLDNGAAAYWDGTAWQAGVAPAA